MVLKSEGTNCFEINDLPEPAGPAIKIAFGLPCISFNKDISPIMDIICHKYNKKGLDNQALSFDILLFYFIS
jgi:hypothetical protein